MQNPLEINVVAVDFVQSSKNVHIFTHAFCRVTRLWKGTEGNKKRPSFYCKMFLGVSIQREKSVQRRPLPNVISMRLQQPIGYCGLRKNLQVKVSVCVHLGCVASVSCQIAVAKAFLVYLGCSCSGQSFWNACQVMCVHINYSNTKTIRFKSHR